MAVTDANTSADFQQIVKDAAGALVVVHFWADWAPQCEQMNEVITELAKKFTKCKFVKIAAESVPEVSQKYEIAAVPTCILIKGSTVLDRVNGANAGELTKKVEKNATGSAPVAAAASPGDAKEDLNTRLKKLINAAPVMLFMKGHPGEPRCGFSRTTVGILQEQGIKFSTFDILSDDEVRQGLKEYSNWPTFPQLYGDGELVGGLDIIKELVESDELKSSLPAQKSLEDRLKELIKKDRIVLFMKGEPGEPRCGFSRTCVGILNDVGVKFGHFDILSDEEVRQGLKKFSNWPTFPQLYVNGELIGGLDIIKELQECGELEATLNDGQ